jgi:uncharacterized protein YjbJ (UPF0337 family)
MKAANPLIKTMHLYQMKAMWHIVKGKLNQNLGRFTQDDQRIKGGKEDELTGRIILRTAQVRDRSPGVKLY